MTNQDPPPPWRIVQSEFITSAAALTDCPKSALPEVAMAGRSNVGKSSLINLLCNRKNLAKTSNTPGKTRLINYFRLRVKPGEHTLHIVDLPGYGFAKTSKADQEHWGHAIQTYLEKRDNLVGIVHLIDSRHPPTRLDWQMREWILYFQVPCITVLTKADKLKASQKKAILKNSQDKLNLPPNSSPILCSTQQKTGIHELTAALVGLVLQKP